MALSNTSRSFLSSISVMIASVHLWVLAVNFSIESDSAIGCLPFREKRTENNYGKRFDTHIRKPPSFIDEGSIAGLIALTPASNVKFF